MEIYVQWESNTAKFGSLNYATFSNPKWIVLKSNYKMWWEMDPAQQNSSKEYDFLI